MTKVVQKHTAQKILIDSYNK